MNANGQLLEALTQSEFFQEYERAYTEATGLPVALRPVETWQIPLHGKRKESPWCALMASKSRTCAACLQMQEKLAKEANQAPATICCDYGLCETAVPVIYILLLSRWIEPEYRRAYGQPSAEKPEPTGTVQGALQPA